MFWNDLLGNVGRQDLYRRGHDADLAGCGMSSGFTMVWSWYHHGQVIGTCRSTWRCPRERISREVGAVDVTPRPAVLVRKLMVVTLVTMGSGMYSMATAGALLPKAPCRTVAEPYVGEVYLRDRERREVEGCPAWSRV